eukprot:m.15879 g.15879  ORF g.15879 m.15879 type:complete len:290 (+) comp3078_c0_seq1:33-902(+)
MAASLSAEATPLGPSCLLSALPAEFWNPKSSTSKQLTKNLLEHHARLGPFNPLTYTTLGNADTAGGPDSGSTDSARKRKGSQMPPKQHICHVATCGKIYKSSTGLNYHLQKVHNITDRRPPPPPAWTSVQLSTVTPLTAPCLPAHPATPSLPQHPQAHTDSAVTTLPAAIPCVFEEMYGHFPVSDSLAIASCPACHALIAFRFHHLHQTACPGIVRKRPALPEPKPPPPSLPASSSFAPIVAPSRMPDSGSKSPLSWRERAMLRQLMDMEEDESPQDSTMRPPGRKRKL